jgi:hypothetical protein
MLNRYREIENWIADFQLPKSVWLGSLFNPQSFLTSIMQAVARKQDWPLDRMCLMIEITKKQKEEIQSTPKDGAYIHKYEQIDQNLLFRFFFLFFFKSVYLSMEHDGINKIIY